MTKIAAFEKFMSKNTKFFFRSNLCSLKCRGPKMVLGRDNVWLKKSEFVKKVGFFSQKAISVMNFKQHVTICISLS